MTAQPNLADDASSPYARVYAAVSSEPVSAKAVQLATALPYSTVTDNLRKLADEGLVVQSKDGSRKMWTRTPAAVPVDQPAADVEPSPAAESFADEAGRRKVETMKKDELLSLCQSLGIATRPAQTRKQLIELATTRIAQNAARVSAEPAVVERPDYAGMNVATLRSVAKDLHVPGVVSKMARAELLQAVENRYDEIAATVETEATDAQDATADAESAVETSAAPDGPWGTPDDSDAPSGSLDAVLADLQAARPVSAPPAQTVSTRRAPVAGGGIVSSGSAPGWGRGECERTLLGILQATPDISHAPSVIVKAWNESRTDGQPIMQPGSVAFALDAMVKKGTARLVQDKPKRYSAAVVPIVA